MSSISTKAALPLIGAGVTMTVFIATACLALGLQQPGGVPRKPAPQTRKEDSRVFGDITAYQTKNVKTLLGASLNSDKDLHLPIYGIAFVGDIRLAGPSQNVFAPQNATAHIASGSTLAIFIIDDITYHKKKSAITIGFKPGHNGYQVSGRIDHGKHAIMTFHDKYGDIVVNGNFDRTHFRGTAFFKSKHSLDPGRLIPLGDVRISTCGFFHCK
jgi:hypothetical protein